METVKTQSHRVSDDVPCGGTDQGITDTRSPKERIRLRIRRSRAYSEVNAMPSIAEAGVRIAAVVMLIALCLQAIHR